MTALSLTMRVGGMSAHSDAEEWRTQGWGQLAWGPAPALSLAARVGA